MWTLDRHEIIEGARIAWRTIGDGPPVVLIHGTPSHSFIWRAVAPLLAAAGKRVYVYDLLGYGASERPLDRPTGVPAQVEILTALLDAWGLERPDIVGHDIGGASAMIFAAHNPARVRRLGLIDIVSYDSWPSATWREIIANHLDDYAAMPADEFTALVTRQLQMTVSDKARMSGEVLAAYLAPFSGRIGRASFWHHQVATYESASTEDVVSRLDRLTMPVRILWGADDAWQPVSYAERLLEDIPDAALRILPGAGHFAMEDRPEVIAEDLVAFLAD